MIVVSDKDKDKNKQPKSAPTLADLFVKMIGADPQGCTNVLRQEPWAKDERELGADFDE